MSLHCLGLMLPPVTWMPTCRSSTRWLGGRKLTRKACQSGAPKQVHQLFAHLSCARHIGTLHPRSPSGSRLCLPLRRADSGPDAVLRHVGLQKRLTALDEPPARCNSREPKRNFTTKSMCTADPGCANFLRINCSCFAESRCLCECSVRVRSLRLLCGLASSTA